MICTVMYGSGAVTGMVETTMPKVPPPIRMVLIQAVAGFCAAARSSVPLCSAALLAASTGGPASGTPFWGSGLLCFQVSSQASSGGD
jgi:hypothetical protein